MEEKIEQLRQEAAKAVKQAVGSLGDLNDIRVKYLGKKGELTTILRGLGQLSKEDRPRIGQIVNDARQQLEQLIAEKNEELREAELNKRLANERIDVTLPGRRAPRGHLHPLTMTLMEIKRIFMKIGSLFRYFNGTIFINSMTTFSIINNLLFMFLFRFSSFSSSRSIIQDLLTSNFKIEKILIINCNL